VLRSRAVEERIDGCDHDWATAGIAAQLGAATLLVADYGCLMTIPTKSTLPQRGLLRATG